MEKPEISSSKFDNMVEQIEKYGACPVTSALKVFGGKWKPLILYFISVDVNRFGLLRNMIPDCSQRMMTRQLRELESDGLLERKVFAEIPPKVTYTLTEKGESLQPIFRELSKWSIENVLDPKNPE